MLGEYLPYHTMIFTLVNFETVGTFEKIGTESPEMEDPEKSSSEIWTPPPPTRILHELLKYVKFTL